MEDVCISIIVPVYNVEKYLEKCIDSILAQTFTKFELILVDDGSTDRSGIICDEYKLRDERIKVIHKENGGLSSARNVGIDIAKGKYIGFVDSDDFIAENMYQVLYDNLVKENADLSMCGIYDYYVGKACKENEPYYKVMDAKGAIQKTFEGKIFTVNAWNKLYKKDLFCDIKYPEGKIVEDAYVIVELFLHCNKVVATSEQLYYYYHRQNSITTAMFSSKNFDVIEAYKENYKLIQQNYPEILDVGMSRLCWAYFNVVDKMMSCGCENVYNREFIECVKFLRKHLFIILKSPYFTRSRKIAMVGLVINKNIYKKFVMLNSERNKKLYQ